MAATIIDSNVIIDVVDPASAWTSWTKRSILEDIPIEAALMAGWAHRAYRSRGGKSRGGKRERTLPDFLIGAHAAVREHRLLTRDPSGYRSYFPEVELVTPETHP